MYEDQNDEVRGRMKQAILNALHEAGELKRAADAERSAERLANAMALERSREVAKQGLLKMFS